MVDYDPAVGAGLEKRGKRIINAENPPGRLHEDPTSKAAYVCKTCNAFNACHKGQFAKRTCRTCLHSTPVENGQWHCEKYDTMLDTEFQRHGCTSHRYIPTLVPGRMTKASDDNVDLTVTYEMPNGGTFIDGPAK
jgi:hypothetical protein